MQKENEKAREGMLEKKKEEKARMQEIEFRRRKTFKESEKARE